MSDQELKALLEQHSVWGNGEPKRSPAAIEAFMAGLTSSPWEQLRARGCQEIRIALTPTHRRVWPFIG